MQISNQKLRTSFICNFLEKVKGGLQEVFMSMVEFVDHVSS